MRSPFVDYRLMEFAFSLPDQLKFDHGVTKRIQRMAFSHRLPGAIVDNHHKIGFATPFRTWLTDPALNAYFQEVVGSASFQHRGIWQGAAIKKRLAQATQHPNFPFWRFINLELWALACGISNL
jgi:asparagine synthase (glutamine-hydrolysing)